MYTIEDLKKIIDAENKYEIDQMKITPEMREINDRMLVVEQEFKKINPSYNIEVTPQVYGSNTELLIVLNYCLESGEISKLHEQSTLYSFRKTGYSDKYLNSKQDASSDEIISSVSFKEDPKLFSKLVENDLISFFLLHQKQLNYSSNLVKKNELARQKLKN